MGAPTFGALVPVGAVEEGDYFSVPGEVDFRKLWF